MCLPPMSDTPVKDMDLQQTPAKMPAYLMLFNDEGIQLKIKN